MKIQLATTADLTTMYDIWFRSVQATHSFLAPGEIDQLAPLVRDYLDSDKTQFWCITDGGPVLGFLGMSGHEIESLFVDPDAFRRGLGTQLVKHAIQLEPNLVVDVNEQNESATAFYKSLGFQVIGRSDLDSQGNAHPLLHLQLKQPQ